MQNKVEQIRELSTIATTKQKCSVVYKIQNCGVVCKIQTPITVQQKNVVYYTKSKKCRNYVYYIRTQWRIYNDILGKITDVEAGGVTIMHHREQDQTFEGKDQKQRKKSRSKIQMKNKTKIKVLKEEIEIEGKAKKNGE